MKLSHAFASCIILCSTGLIGCTEQDSDIKLTGVPLAAVEQQEIQQGSENDPQIVLEPIDNEQSDNEDPNAVTPPIADKPSTDPVKDPVKDPVVVQDPAKDPVSENKPDQNEHPKADPEQPSGTLSDCGKIAAGKDALCVEVTRVQIGGSCRDKKGLTLALPADKISINLFEAKALGALLGGAGAIPSGSQISRIELAAASGKLYLDGKFVSNVRVPSGKIVFNAKNMRSVTAISKLGFDPEEVKKSVITRGSSGKDYNIASSNFDLVALP